MPSEIWEHEGKRYECLVYYCVPDDAWSVELTAMDGSTGFAHALIPDEDIERPCQVVGLDNDALPSEILARFVLQVVEEARRAGMNIERLAAAPTDDPVTG